MAHRKTLFGLNISTSVLLLSGLGVALAACSDPEPEDKPELDPRILYTFESCDDMLSHAKDMLAEHGGLYDQYPDFGFEEGIGDTGGAGGTDGGFEPGNGEGDTGGGGAPPEFSDTNVQEAGVDEPDLVKTDGIKIMALAKGELHYVAPNDGASQLLGSLTLGTSDGAQMFLVDDRVLLIDQISNYDYGGYDGYGEPGYGPQLPDPPEVSQWFKPGEYNTVTRITEVDISDPAAMKVVANLYVGANYVSARKVDVSSRVVLRSYPRGLEFKSPWDFIYEWQYDDQLEDESEPGGGGSGGGTGDDVPQPIPDTPDAEPAPDAEPGEVSFRDEELNPWDQLWEAAVAAAKEHNDQVIDESTPENWLPKYVYEDVANGGQITEGLLHDCNQVMYPGTYSGLGIVSVLSLDLSSQLTLGDAVGVMSEGETVYASRENLYVATTPWSAQQHQEPGVTSYIHKFDVGDPDKAEYVASGEVPGYLLSQWSMSEHDGDLRVATTDHTADWSEESQVTILREDGEANLEQIGQVGGLGKGERIYAVRFIADKGYVVTFRQIDPLYTIDASDPTAPTVAGELKIPGYSAYLHPIGEGMLLGVGREGNDEGQVFGTQLSIFDVTDIANPVQLHTAAVTSGDGGGSSEVEWDHKAFLYWEPTSMAMLPVSWWSYDDINGEGYFSGAIGYNVDVEAGITEIAQVTHPQPEGEEGWYWNNNLRRSLVIGDAVYTVSHHGLKASNLGDLTDMSWLEF